MSNTNENLSAAQSPAGPGHNIKRLSKKPLILIAFIGLLFIAAFIWSGQQRGQSAQQHQDNKEKVAHSGSSTAVSKVLGTVNEGQVTAPLGTSVTLQELLSGEHGMFTEAKQEQTAISLPTVASEPEQNIPPPETASPPGPSPEELAAQERLLRAKQQAYEDFVRALNAPTAVNSGLNYATQQQSTGTGSLSLPSPTLPASTPNSDINYTALHQQALQRLQQQQRQQQQWQSDLSGLLGTPRTNTTHTSSTDNNALRYRQLSPTRQAPRGDTVLTPGTVIPAVLITGINSDLPGELLAQTSEDVFDTRTGQHILIPKGSKLVGRYSSNIEAGQERVTVIWHRINYPDSSTLDLSAMTGIDLAGYSGLHDQVDHHTVDKFKEATLLSLITGAAQLSQSGNDDASQQMIGALGQQYAQIGQEVVKRKLDKAPTITIRPGIRFNVLINQDLVLAPYQPMTKY